MDVESILSQIYEVAKSNGGYLTIREAARNCSRHFVDKSHNNICSCNNTIINNNISGYKDNVNKRSDNCSSNDSQGGCCSQGIGSNGCVCSSGGGCDIGNTRSNDRAEECERMLKDIVKSSNLFKLNGNVLFVNAKIQPIQMKSHLTNRSHLSELRRNSLPGLVPETHQQINTSTNDSEYEPQEVIDSMVDCIGGISDVSSTVTRSINRFKHSIFKHPLQFNMAGENQSNQLLETTSALADQSIRCDRLSKSVKKSNGGETEILTSRIPRSQSLDEAIAENQHHLTRPAHGTLPPSYLATPGAFNAIPGSSWSDMEYFSKRYRNSDRLVVIMKNFETDVQMALERLIKQMRSEMDSMLVDLHRPTNKNLGEGTVFCVQKKWGIIDLGNHDHVFFDMSIMLGHVDDLRNHFQVGEVLGFEAVRAQKSSRANWRAIHVWKVSRVEGQHERIHNYQDNPMKQVIPDRIYNRLCESESSKGNSPDASPGRWKEKQLNPLSNAVAQDGVLNCDHRSVCELKSARLGPSTFNQSPLIPKSYLLLNADEIRLTPCRFLTPPDSKKTGLTNRSVTSCVTPQRITGSSNQKMSNPLNVINHIQRDSGTESGNSSPDAVHKNDADLKSRDAKQNDNNVKNVYCQTEIHI